MSLEANDLVLFAQVVEAGSFSQAAERAGLPKSTLSRRISQLENTLGERLLVRTTRRLTLTDFGASLLEHARRLLAETEAAAAFASSRQGTPRGLLRVSLPPDFAELDLSQLILQYATQYPEVQLELDLSPRRVDLLTERFDLAVRAAASLPDDAMLVARQLGRYGNALYASPAYLARYGQPQHPDELLTQHTGLRMIGGNGEVLPWRLTCGDRQWQGLPHGPLAANSLPLQRDLALHGLGIVGLSDPFARRPLAEGRVQRVLPEWQLPTITLWCLTPGRHLQPTRTTAFIELLKAAMGH